MRMTELIIVMIYFIFLVVLGLITQKKYHLLIRELMNIMRLEKELGR